MLEHLDVNGPIQGPPKVPNKSKPLGTDQDSSFSDFVDQTYDRSDIDAAQSENDSGTAQPTTIETEHKAAANHVTEQRPHFEELAQGISPDSSAPKSQQTAIQSVNAEGATETVTEAATAPSQQAVEHQTSVKEALETSRSAYSSKPDSIPGAPTETALLANPADGQSTGRRKASETSSASFLTTPTSQINGSSSTNVSALEQGKLLNSKSALTGDGLANDGNIVDALNLQIDDPVQGGALDDRIITRAESRGSLFSGPIGSRLRLDQTASAVRSGSGLALTTIAPLAAQSGEAIANWTPELLQATAQTANYTSQNLQSTLLSQDISANLNLPAANRAADSTTASLLNAFQDIRFSGQQEKERVVIQLDPPELGRVSLDFKFDGSTVTSISVTSENPEALKRLREYQFELMNALAERGLSGGNLTYHQNGGNQNSGSETNLDLPAETEKSPDIYNTIQPSQQNANIRIQPNSRHLNLSL